MRAAALVLAAGLALVAEAGAGAQGPSVSFAGAPALGDPRAPIVVIEFSDFHCPFCRRHTKDTLPQIKKDYIDAGLVLYVYRHFPAGGSRPGGIDAAVAAQCAARQDRFWELHDRFFSAPRPVQPGDLERHARAAGVNVETYRTCVKAGLAREDVRADVEQARRLGLAGTPGFAIGLRDDEERVRVMQRIGGAQPYAAFKAVLDALLDKR